jgi:hypothetical protein
MACIRCGSNFSSNTNYIPPIPIICTETKQSYIDLLVKVEIQLVDNPQFNIFTQVVKSQIINYDKNCGLFQQYIIENIIPIII